MSRKPAGKSAPTAPPEPPGTPAPKEQVAPDRPRVSADEFQAAIQAEIEQTQQASLLPGQVLPAASGAQSGGPQPAPAFDPAALTLEGLASAWQLPFYGLAELLRVLGIAPDPEPVVAVGRRRAIELARPSYVIYQELCQRYLGVHPENTVHVAAGVTVLDGIGIAPDLFEAVKESRRRAGRIPKAGPDAITPPPAS